MRLMVISLQPLSDKDLMSLAALPLPFMPSEEEARHWKQMYRAASADSLPPNWRKLQITAEKLLVHIEFSQLDFRKPCCGIKIRHSITYSNDGF